jgi:hypothetical protein
VKEDVFRLLDEDLSGQLLAWAAEELLADLAEDLAEDSARL